MINQLLNLENKLKENLYPKEDNMKFEEDEEIYFRQ